MIEKSSMMQSMTHWWHWFKSWNASLRSVIWWKLMETINWWSNGYQSWTRLMSKLKYPRLSCHLILNKLNINSSSADGLPHVIRILRPFETLCSSLMRLGCYSDWWGRFIPHSYDNSKMNPPNCDDSWFLWIIDGIRKITSIDDLIFMNDWMIDPERPETARGCSMTKNGIRQSWCGWPSRSGNYYRDLGIIDCKWYRGHILTGTLNSTNYLMKTLKKSLVIFLFMPCLQNTGSYRQNAWNN